MNDGLKLGMRANIHAKRSSPCQKMVIIISSQSFGDNTDKNLPHFTFPALLYYYDEQNITILKRIKYPLKLRIAYTNFLCNTITPMAYVGLAVTILCCMVSEPRPGYRFIQMFCGFIQSVRYTISSLKQAITSIQTLILISWYHYTIMCYATFTVEMASLNNPVSKSLLDRRQLKVATFTTTARPTSQPVHACSLYWGGMSVRQAVCLSVGWCVARCHVERTSRRHRQTMARRKNES